MKKLHLQYSWKVSKSVLLSKKLDTLLREANKAFVVWQPLHALRQVEDGMSVTKFKQLRLPIHKSYYNVIVSYYM